jgi:hypothetical protein
MGTTVVYHNVNDPDPLHMEYSKPPAETFPLIVTEIVERLINYEWVIVIEYDQYWDLKEEGGEEDGEVLPDIRSEVRSGTTSDVPKGTS